MYKIFSKVPNMFNTFNKFLVRTWFYVDLFCYCGINVINGCTLSKSLTQCVHFLNSVNNVVLVFLW